MHFILLAEITFIPRVKHQTNVNEHQTDVNEHQTDVNDLFTKFRSYTLFVHITTHIVTNLRQFKIPCLQHSYNQHYEGTPFETRFWCQERI